MKKNDSLPDIVRRRIEISALFYPLSRHEERKWARIFQKDITFLFTRLEADAGRLKFVQELVKNQFILWRDPDTNKNECIFYPMRNATSFQSLQQLIQNIETYDPTFTYAIVHQKKDGEGTFDIFRLSAFSYLEHCNRVKV
jgi:hypothetical protein